MSLIAGLTNQTIASICSVTTDGYSDKTRSILYEDVKCRWNERVGRVIDVNKEELTYKVEVWLPPDYTIQKDYLVKKDNEFYTIVEYEKKYSLEGKLDHIKVYLE